MLSTGTRHRPRRPLCPTCRYYDQVVPIVYGFPSPEMVSNSRRGEVALGGSCASPDAHQWYCKGCLESFSSPGFQPERARAS